MKIKLTDPPRVFKTGMDKKIEISDCGRIYLDADEMVTFITESGKQYDLAAKSWGFYATPSVNARLKNEGFRAALVKNSQERYYVMLVEKERMEDFKNYLKVEKNQVVQWLDEL